MAHDGRVWTPRVFSPPASVGPDKSSEKAAQQQLMAEQSIRPQAADSANPKPCTSEEAGTNSTADTTRRPKIGKKPKVFETSDPSMQNSECQVPGCGVGLFETLKRKVRICDKHRQALKLQMDGFEGRFCQQCSRVHKIECFDGSRRGCRKRLRRRVERMRETKPSDDDNMMDGRMTAEGSNEGARAAGPSSHYYDYYYGPRSGGGDRGGPAHSGGDERGAIARRSYYDYYRGPAPEDMRGEAEWRGGGGPQSDSWWSQGGPYNYNPLVREGGAMPPHPRPPHREPHDFRSMPNDPGGSHSPFPPETGSAYYPPPHGRSRPSMPPSAHMPEPSDPYYRNYHNYMAYQSSMGGMPPSRGDKEDESSSMGAMMHDSRRPGMDFPRGQQDFPAGGSAQRYPPRAKKYGPPAHMCSGPECRTCHAFYYYSS